MPPPKISESLADAIRELDLRLIQQRISMRVVTPEPNAVQFDFLTTLPTSPIVEVFTLTQRDGVLIFDSGTLLLAVAFNFLPNPGSTDHHARLTGLPQETECMYRIRAGHSTGGLAVTTGTFRTGRRDVSVVIRAITIFNDGDPGMLGGSGQLTFDFGLYNERDERVAQREHRADISSGEVRDLPFGTAPAMAHQHAGDWASIYVLGVEEDADVGQFLENFPAPLTLPTAATAYENDDEVYVDAMQTLALPSTNGEHRVGFTLNSGPQGIFYIITGWLTVVVSCPPPTRYLRLGKVKKSATMNARGTRTLIVTPSGKRTEFAISPAGDIAKNVEGRRWRAAEWKILAEARADAATVVAHDVDLVVVSVEEGGLTTRRVRADDERPARGDVVCQDLRPQLSRADSPSGICAIGVVGHRGDVWVLLIDATGAVGQPVAVGGRLAHAPTLSWLDDETLVLGGISEAGDVVVARLATDRLASPGIADVDWTAIPSEPIIALCAVIDDDGAPLLVGLTGDRRLLSRALEDDGWSSSWQEMGTLDDPMPMADEQVATATVATGMD